MTANIINVIDLGADPTGTNPSDEAFEAAITAFKANGGAIYIPTGDYKITRTVLYRTDGYHPGIRMFGDGAASRLLVAYNGPILEIEGTRSAASGGVPYQFQRGGYLKDFQIIRVSGTYPLSVGLRITGWWLWEIAGLIIETLGSHGIEFPLRTDIHPTNPDAYASVLGQMRGTQVTRCGGWGVDGASGMGFAGNTLTQNNISINAAGGVRIGGSGNRVIGNTIATNGRPSSCNLKLDRIHGNAMNNIIEQNEFDSGYQESVFVVAAVGGRISHNRFPSWVINHDTGVMTPQVMLRLGDAGSPQTISGLEVVGNYFRSQTLADIISKAPAWSSGKTYAAGNIVSSSGAAWKSLQGANLNHAVVEGAWWTQVTEEFPITGIKAEHTSVVGLRIAESSFPSGDNTPVLTKYDGFTTANETQITEAGDIILAAPTSRGFNGRIMAAQNVAASVTGGVPMWFEEYIDYDDDYYSGSIGDVTIGSNLVQNVTNIANWAVGCSIRGPKILTNTTVTAVGAGTLTLSANATGTHTRVGLWSLATSLGDTTSGSRKLTNVTNASRWRGGMPISGSGIPVNTTVLSVSGTNVYVSKPATTTASSVLLTGNAPGFRVPWTGRARVNLALTLQGAKAGDRVSLYLWQDGNLMKQVDAVAGTSSTGYETFALNAEISVAKGAQLLVAADQNTGAELPLRVGLAYNTLDVSMIA